MAGTLPIVTEETERMVALKKAYAEMILNTAKEAAARVMAAERKAKKFEHDLNSTKEEALRMLLRFKKMIEDKNAEAEVASLNQQRRIEELELQLDEAEGLILDLRAKLDKVQEQLEDAKSKPLQSLRPNGMVDMSCCHVSFAELESKSVSSEVQTSSWDPSINVHQCLRPLESAISGSEFDNGLVDNPVFAYIVLDKKEPELYRNICTQRIRAIEKGLVDEKMSQIDESHSLAQSISIIQRNGGSRITPSTIDKLNGIGNIVKDASLFEDNATKDQPVKVQKLRRRKTRYGKTKATKCKYLSGQCVKPQRTSSAVARYKNYSLSSKDVDKSGNTSSKTEHIDQVENGSESFEKVQLGKHQSVSVVRRSVRKRKVKYWDDFATSCRPVETHPRQYEETSLKDEAVKCGAKSSESLLKVKHEGEFEEGNCKAAFTTVTSMKACGASCSVGVAERETKLIHEPMLVKHNGVAVDMELENRLLIPTDKRNTKASELTNKVPSLTDSNNPLQYTFSRKRKKGSLVNHDVGYSSRECSMERRSTERKDIELVAQNNIVGDESTSDGRGLVNVAHQLISLSGKRWW